MDGHECHGRHSRRPGSARTREAWTHSFLGGFVVSVVMSQCLGEIPARSGFYADGGRAQHESAGTECPCSAERSRREAQDARDRRPTGMPDEVVKKKRPSRPVLVFSETKKNWCLGIGNGGTPHRNRIARCHRDSEGSKASDRMRWRELRRRVRSISGDRAAARRKGMPPCGPRAEAMTETALAFPVRWREGAPESRREPLPPAHASPRAA